MGRSKIILLFSLAAILLFTAACGSNSTNPYRASHRPSTKKANTTYYASSIAQRDYTESMPFGGISRTYYIHLPVSYSGQKSAPLVLAFHGSDATGQDLANQSHLNDISEEGSFIVVYPDGYQKQWADGRGTTPPEQAGIDDVGFVSTLIDKLRSELNIDATRVYVTGLSNGGIFVQRLACELTDKIAAIASISATIAANIAARCQPSRPIPVLVFMGTDDPSVPFYGGEVDGDQGNDLSTTDTIQLWVTNNGCSAIPSVTQVLPVVNDGSGTFRTEYTNCKDNANVVLYTIQGGVHTWPGEDATTHTANSNNLDASQTLWEFFQQYQ